VRECTELIRGWRLPEPFDIHTLCDHLAARRGRPIRLAPVALPADSPGGLLVSTEAADYIFYEARTSPVHQWHVIAHELGHLLWEHRSGAPCAETARQLLPEDFSPGLVRHMLGRGHYDDPDEYAAELFATVILREVTHWTPDPPGAAPEVADLVARLERSWQGAEGGRR
jgi:hypothetical protein